jgi:hypothetical protein
VEAPANVLEHWMMYFDGSLKPYVDLWL